MKFGIVTYDKRPMRKGSNNALNLGDPIQTYAMQHIYKTMGVSDEDLVNISRYHAAEYNGEYAVLPFNCFNMIGNTANHKYNTLPLSPNIIPVFISFHLHSREISSEIIENLRSYQPIGCRDEETMINLRKHGLVAYLSGCATAVLPRRGNIPKAKKAFFVDVPESILKHIPNEIKTNAEFVSHQPPFQRLSDELYLTDDEYVKFYESGIKILERYRNEATLVVTSRLHAASPCLAMGIPVILVGNNFDGRFSWIDKHLKLYTPDMFNDIDWYPEVVDYEYEKQEILQMFTNRIKSVYEVNKNLYNISNYYENRKRITYNNGILKFLKKNNISEHSNFKYSIWGITDKSLTLLNVISDRFPNMSLKSIIDENINGSFEGIEVKKSNVIDKHEDDVVYFIVPKAAHKYAAEYLDKRSRMYIIVDF